MTLLGRIKALCEASNITINRLEKEADLSRGSVAKWDKHTPSNDKLEKVANYFNVSVAYLRGDSEQDIYSITFRRNLWIALSTLDGFEGVEEAEFEYRRLSEIAEAKYPLSLAEACEIADVIGESLDTLLDTENSKKSSPSKLEDELTGNERLILNLVSLIPSEKQEFLISWLKTELQQD